MQSAPVHAASAPQERAASPAGSPYEGFAHCVSAPVRPRSAGAPTLAQPDTGPSRRTRSATLVEAAAAIAAVAAYEGGAAGTPHPPAAGAPAGGADAGAGARASGGGAAGAAVSRGGMRVQTPAFGIGFERPAAREAAVANPYVNTGLANPFACAMGGEDGGGGGGGATPGQALCGAPQELRTASAPLRSARYGAGGFGFGRQASGPHLSLNPNRASSPRPPRAMECVLEDLQARNPLGGMTPAASAPQIRIRLPVPHGPRGDAGLGQGSRLFGSNPQGQSPNPQVAAAPQPADAAGAPGGRANPMGRAAAAWAVGGSYPLRLQGDAPPPAPFDLAAMGVTERPPSRAENTAARGEAGLPGPAPVMQGSRTDCLQHVDHLLAVQRHMRQVRSVHDAGRLRALYVMGLLASLEGSTMV